MFGACDDSVRPDWLANCPDGSSLGDFDAPTVWYTNAYCVCVWPAAASPTTRYRFTPATDPKLLPYSATPRRYNATPSFPTPSGELRSWVMYYSVYITTPDVADDDGEYGTACMGRATATGTVDALSWTDDGSPVYCSNTAYDDYGYPNARRYDTEAEYVEAVDDGYGIDPAFLRQHGREPLHDVGQRHRAHGRAQRLERPPEGGRPARGRLRPASAPRAMKRATTTSSRAAATRRRTTISRTSTR